MNERGNCAAAFQSLTSPDWSAFIVHVPADTSVTVDPDTVQTGWVEEEKATASPLVAVAERVKVPVPRVRFERASKVIVWFCL